MGFLVEKSFLLEEKKVRKLVAEAIGTFILVFIGTGGAVLSGESIGYLGIGLGFGLAVMVAAYTVGTISGAHLNPAVSLAMLMNKRMNLTEFSYYIIGQLIGAFAGSGALLFILKAGKYATDNLAQTTYGDISILGAFFVEAVLTFLLVFVILMVTSQSFGVTNAGLIIGLTLAALHVIGVPMTGMSVNPVRSFAPALLVGGEALTQVWLYIAAPLVGGALAAILAKSFLHSESEKQAL